MLAQGIRTMAETKDNKTGRPTLFNDEMSDLICERIAEGLSVVELCKPDDMPSKSSVFKWLAENEGFSDKYVRACETRTELIADEMLNIADDGSNDWMERKDGEGNVIGTKPDNEAIQRSRLRVDTRKWILSKLQPKKYGERVTQDVNLTGSITALLGEIDGTGRNLPDD